MRARHHRSATKSVPSDLLGWHDGPVETLPNQFNEALTLIGLSDKAKRAQEAHREIRELLEKSEDLCDLGIDTVLIGSYGRGTAIYPGKDVDVFAKLTNATTDDDPIRIFEIVAAVLMNEYGDRAKPQSRSVKVDFPDEFAVDVVPAVVYGDRWAIPSRDIDLWGQDEGWVDTDPETLGKLSEAQNSAPKVGSRGAYKPVVKLMRQTRRHHLVDAKPGGFYFELLTYCVFDAGVSGDSFAEFFAAALRGAANQLATGTILDPVLGTPYSPEPDPNDTERAAAAFTDLADKAEQALQLAPCPAAVLWREILGKNKQGECFPLPPGCDEHGNEIKKTRVAAVGSGEAGAFA
jgi:hypothetical protein